MHSKEAKVSTLSDYYLYTPSTLARELYFYPICIGQFSYEPNYYIKRTNYDNFLIMYIVSGECIGVVDNHPFHAKKNQCVLLNCYAPHEYGSSDSFEAIWLHFDGPLAKNYYHHIITTYGNVFTPNNPHNIYQSIDSILHFFRKSKPIQESLISTYITNILTEFLYSPVTSDNISTNTSIIEDSVSYINTHFSKSLSLTALAENANLSLFYFTRLFTKETGFTPHQYLLATRIQAAKFLLKSSDTSVKEIAFRCGFQSESNFCSTFKKREGFTPSQYRNTSTL